MQIKYNKENDIVYIQLSEAPIAESDEDKKGVIIDYADDGSIVGIEILNASKNLNDPSDIKYVAA
ncbi:MAG: DUF2283 domain-containing protein [Chitinophagales bacterium]